MPKDHKKKKKLRKRDVDKLENTSIAGSLAATGGECNDSCTAASCVASQCVYDSNCGSDSICSSDSVCSQSSQAELA